MNGHVYLMETLTNLHVGDMGNSFSIIDKCVQRDALTGYPAIYATSLKGALRNAAEADQAVSAVVAEVFGEDVTSSKSSKGTYSFHDAHLLFYPVRSNIRPYFLATCPAMLADAIRICEIAGCACAAQKLRALLGLKPGVLYVDNAFAWTNEQIAAENMILSVEVNEVVKSVLNWLDGEPGIALLNDEDMKELAEELPIVARNLLENGISKNLWYEEFVPRKSCFITLMLAEKENEAFASFMEKQNCIQIGANATVGYGLCRFSSL